MPLSSLLVRAGRVLCERSELARAAVARVNFPGKARLVHKLRPDRLPEHPTLQRCGDLTYLVNLRDDMQRAIYFGTHEQHDLALALERVPAGGVAVDVGANVGFYALNLARHVGPSGRVIAFEPDPGVRARLERNCELNGLGAVLRVRPEAVTDPESAAHGTLTFYQSESQHSGWGSLHHFADIAAGAVSVSTTTLDAALEESALLSPGAIDLLKIDVEAHEFELLAGATRTLALRVPRAVFIEWNGVRMAERGRTLQEFLRVFNDAGYSAISPTDWLAAVQARRADPARVVVNLLFVPGEAPHRANR